MNRKLFLIACLVSIALIASVLIADAQGPRPDAKRAPAALAGTAFTYQGQLKNGGALVNSTCDFLFGLWDSLTVGTQVGTTQTVSSLSVTNGLFTTPLDFGDSAFTGDGRWLAIRVRCPAGGGSYTSLAPRESLTPAPIAFSLPGLYTQQNATSPNIIGGYSGNIISNTLVGATISGGGSPGNVNAVTADYGTIAGGHNNSIATSEGTIGGGRNNTINGFSSSTIAGGVGNLASGSVASVGGGTANVASGERATVAGGFFNTASGGFSTVPGGNEAVASHYGEMAYASGYFNPGAYGNAQTSIYVMRNTTTDATPTELFLDGTAVRLTIPISRVMTFEILVVGVNTNTGVSAGYRLSGVIKNIGGTTSFVGSPTQDLWENVMAWDATVIADDPNDALVVQVTGAGTANIRWVASVRTSEVAY